MYTPAAFAIATFIPPSTMLDPIRTRNVLVSVTVKNNYVSNYVLVKTFGRHVIGHVLTHVSLDSCADGEVKFPRRQ